MDYASLPSKRMGSGCLLFDEHGKMLLVKPSYKDTWEIPGGIVENNESPKEACIREVKEELSIDLDNIRLLVVDYNTYPEQKEKTESLMFIFDGGVIDPASIALDFDDHETFEFVDEKSLSSRLAGPLLRRAELALQQKKQGCAVSSDNQQI